MHTLPLVEGGKLVVRGADGSNVEIDIEITYPSSELP
jgi:hypothetical protein